MVTNQISDGVLSAQRAVDCIKDNRSTEDVDLLDSEEFGCLYKSIKEVSGYVDTEFLKLRKSLKQWDVFFSTILHETCIQL